METHRSINESTWNLDDVLGADRAGGDWSTWQHHQGGVWTSKALTALQWMSQLQKSFTLERYSTDVVLAWWLSASKAHAYFQLIRLLFVSDGTKVFYISYSSAAYLNHFLANPLVLHERGGMVDKRLHMFCICSPFIYHIPLSMMWLHWSHSVDLQLAHLGLLLCAGFIQTSPPSGRIWGTCPLKPCLAQGWHAASQRNPTVGCIRHFSIVLDISWQWSQLQE